MNGYEQLRQLPTIELRLFFRNQNGAPAVLTGALFYGRTFSKPHGFGLFFHAAISLQTGPKGSSAVDFPRTFVVLTVKDPEVSRKF